MRYMYCSKSDIPLRATPYFLGGASTDTLFRYFPGKSIVLLFEEQLNCSPSLLIRNYTNGDFIISGKPEAKNIKKWSIWTRCSKSCGKDSRQTRIRYSCIHNHNTGKDKDCTISTVEQRNCKVSPCPGKC